MRTIVWKRVSLTIVAMMTLVAGAQAQELEVTDTQNSGCLRMALTDGEGDGEEGESTPLPTIVLEKEGDILSVQLLNYVSNCATAGFDVNSNLNEDTQDTAPALLVDVKPITNGVYAHCLCPYNVSFTIHDLEQDSFYLTCWWFEGMVELTEGEPLVLEDTFEKATADGVNYTLRKALRRAQVERSEWKGEVTIPSEVNFDGLNYSVTSIQQDAFRNDTALTKVFIPRTVSLIDFEEMQPYNVSPFSRCSALQEIVVEEGNPVWSDIDGVLFSNDKTILYSYPTAATRSQYNVPEGIKMIVGSAFAKNQHLLQVSMPDDVTFVGPNLFSGCTNLVEVRLSEGIKNVPGGFFADCASLKTVNIPQGVTALGRDVFANCTSLSEVTMPESVVEADYAVFSGCKALKSVTLSPNLKMINNRLFADCDSLEEILIPDGVTAVMTDAFKNCVALRILDIPESVCRLGNTVFDGCKMDSLIIRGIIEERWMNGPIFDGLNTWTKMYVQHSEVPKFARIYRGPVYPLPEQADGIDDINSTAAGKEGLYDLQGRRLHSKPHKGVYIRNGRKYVE